MEEITPDGLKEKVEEISREYDFPIFNLLAGKDDYSRLPEDLGVLKRDEILIGCYFSLSNLEPNRRVCLEYRLWEGEFNSFIVAIWDRWSFEAYPEAQRIVENSLSEAGIRLQSRSGCIVAQLDPSMDSVQRFLSTYFQAKKKADEYIAERNRLERELNSRYSAPLN